MCQGCNESISVSKEHTDGLGCTISCSSDIGIDLVFDGLIREAQALMVSDAHLPQFLHDLQQQYFVSMTQALSPAARQSL